MIGTDGWYDGRAGNIDETNMRLNDFVYINELRVNDFREIKSLRIKKKLAKLSQVGISQIENRLPELFKTFHRVILATHVPPFREASTHNDKPCTDEAAPFFVNQKLGETLLSIMEVHPDRELLVLCGHTHSAEIYQPMANLTVRVGGAEYGDPKPQDPISL